MPTTMVATAHFSESCDSTVLTKILNDEVNLAVWRRAPSSKVSAFTKTALRLCQSFADSRVIEVADDAQVDLSGLATTFRDYEGYAHFLDDVAWLVQAYGCLLGGKKIGLRLRILEKAMCPRYHVDWVSVRLITTYGGAGSEWLEEGAMNRAFLGEPEAEPKGEPNCMSAGDVALFKGERWDGNQGRGIIHRSPQAGAGERRLILTLDWLE